MSLSVTMLTGQSGSGKSTALRALEDLGYLCIDNLPPSLIEGLIGAVRGSGGPDGLALVIDVRDPGRLEDAPELIDRLRQGPNPVRLVFFEAQEEMLVRRYSETRRRHPLDSGQGLRASLARERTILAPLRALADDAVDTSAQSPHGLRAYVTEKIAGFDVGCDLRLALLSFGFKYGLPLDADVVLDVRFLPNPHFVPELRPLTGLDAAVHDYVVGSDTGGEFVDETYRYLSYLLPHFRREGKQYLTVAVGCTGGRHRSVAVARALASRFENDATVTVLRHRDVEETQS